MRRRWWWTGAAALLSGCFASLVQAEEAAGLEPCIGALRAELPRHPEVTRDTFDTYTRGVQDLRPVIEAATQSQPEFKIPIWDYLARRVDAERIAEGRELLQREAQALRGIRERQGIDGATVVAVFGVETDYGKFHGRYPVVDATLSRACLNLASSERKSHFFAALWLLQQGLVQPDEFRGSWAGAFGMTQFMPGTFIHYMDDGDGSGKPDILHSPADALATTARYLKGLGWLPDVPWGVEVRVPAELAAQANALEGDHACLANPNAGVAGKCRSVQQWAAQGVSMVSGEPLLGKGRAGALPADLRTALLMPAGPTGPAWLVTPNYQAVWRYNRADTYALAIGLLADALRGGPAVAARWPTDDPGLSRAELRELQGLLRQHGHCDVTADGREGPLTRAAIEAEEAHHNMPVSGRAGLLVLLALRASASAEAACAALLPASAAAQ
jgi:lytic murein transglycosylase